MNRYFKRTLSLALGVVIISSGSMTVLADGVKNPSSIPIEHVNSQVQVPTENIETAAKRAIESKMNSEVLYIVEKDVYRDALRKNTAIVEGKDYLLVINSEEISDEEMTIIESSESFFILGETKEDLVDLKETDNFKGQMFGDEKYKAATEIASMNIENDILIVNSDSFADSITASQLSRLENRNILLVNEAGIPEETELYLKENGKDKDILFLEGELKIAKETRNQIMEIAGSDKYELDKANVLKKAAAKIENSRYGVTLPKTGSNENKSTDSLMKKVNELSNETTKKSNEESEELISDKGKLIVYEPIKKELNDAIESEDELPELKDVEDNEKSKSTFIELISEDETLDVLKNKDIVENESLPSTDEVSEQGETEENKPEEDVDVEEIIKNNEAEEDVENHSLMLTYAKPISTDLDVKEGLEEFITPKAVSDEIINSIMEGDYGNGQERKHKLEREGYNYDEIQAEIQKVVTERQLAYEETLRQERELRGSQVQSNSSQPSNQVTQANPQVNPGSAPMARTFINEALKMQGWVYSQPNRWAEGYADCSSIVVRALINSGITSNTSNLTTRTIANDPRFYEVSMSEIEAGDVLWYSGHMEIYMGGNSTFGAFRPGKLSGYASNIGRFNRAFRISGR